MLKDCVIKGAISKDMENGIENVKAINQAIFDLHVMKNEYYIVVRHVESLPYKTKKIIVPYLKGEKDLQELADEMCIEKDSAKQRTYRIRKQIKDKVFPYFEDYSSGGTDKKTICPSYNSNNVEGV